MSGRICTSFATWAPQSQEAGAVVAGLIVDLRLRVFQVSCACVGGGGVGVCGCVGVWGFFGVASKMCLPFGCVHKLMVKIPTLISRP